MKKLLSMTIVWSLFVCLIYSCGSSNSPAANEGTTSIKIKKDQVDEVNFKCTGCAEHLAGMKAFNKVVAKLSDDTRNNLKYPLSYNPEDISLAVIPQDSLYLHATGEKLEGVSKVISTIQYIAKNAYGNELEGDGTKSLYVKGDSILNLEGKLRLEPLKKEDDGVNRNLLLISLVDESQFIRIIPTKTSIIATSSHRCIDEEARLRLHFKDDDEYVTKYSFNDFNCDGNSFYYSFSKKEKDKIRNGELEYVSITDDGEIVLCNVPENEIDYFKQLVEIL